MQSGRAARAAACRHGSARGLHASLAAKRHRHRRMRVLPWVPVAAHASCHACARRAHLCSASNVTLEGTYLRVGQQGKLSRVSGGRVRRTRIGSGAFKRAAWAVRASVGMCSRLGQHGDRASSRAHRAKAEWRAREPPRGASPLGRRLEGRGTQRSAARLLTG